MEKIKYWGYDWKPGNYVNNFTAERTLANNAENKPKIYYICTM